MLLIVSNCLLRTSESSKLRKIMNSTNQQIKQLQQIHHYVQSYIQTNAQMINQPTEPSQQFTFQYAQSFEQLFEQQNNQIFEQQYDQQNVDKVIQQITQSTEQPQEIEQTPKNQETMTKIPRRRPRKPIVRTSQINMKTKTEIINDIRVIQEQIMTLQKKYEKNNEIQSGKIMAYEHEIQATYAHLTELFNLIRVERMREITEKNMQQETIRQLNEELLKYTIHLQNNINQ